MNEVDRRLAEIESQLTEAENATNIYKKLFCCGVATGLKAGYKKSIRPDKLKEYENRINAIIESNIKR